MTTNASLFAKLSRFTLAAAVVAIAAVSVPSFGGDSSTAGLSREDAIKVARPLKNAGDPEIRNMPVLAGHNYRG